MSSRGFLEKSTRHRASDAIRFIESTTAAEVVVAVRKAAGPYRNVSAAFGAALAIAAFTVMWFSPTLYNLTWIFIDSGLAFALGFGLCAFFGELRRALSSISQRQRTVAEAARRTFDELGIHKTKDRTGVLVFVSLFERLVVVLTDDGVPLEVLGSEYAEAVDAMTRAVDELNEDAFLSGLRQLAQPLAQALPRQPDDENELSDDVA